jgi:hypothetical protein
MAHFEIVHSGTEEMKRSPAAVGAHVDEEALERFHIAVFGSGSIPIIGRRRGQVHGAIRLFGKEF